MKSVYPEFPVMLLKYTNCMSMTKKTKIIAEILITVHLMAQSGLTRCIALTTANKQVKNPVPQIETLRIAKKI